MPLLSWKSVFVSQSCSHPLSFAAAGGSPAGNGGDPAAGGLNLGMLSGFMQQDGPTIQAVVLKADGSAQELEVDMSPRKNEIGQILGGSSTFLGQLETENVVVMMRRDTDGLEENRTQLPAPLDRAEVVLGDLLLLRMDEGAQPRSFTLQEYREYCAKNPARE